MDDIELPPLPDPDRSPSYASYEVKEYARACVLADRQKRAQPERKVRTGYVLLAKHGELLGIFQDDGPCPEPLHSEHLVTLKWDDKGPWIDSVRTRCGASTLRRIAKNPALCESDAQDLRNAAAALDGGQ